MMTSSPTPHSSSAPLTVSVVVHAPLAAVWQAYTSAADIMQWNQASPDWHTPSAQVDLRVGGRFCARMEAKDGSMGFDFEGIYTEVVLHQRLAYRFGERQAVITFLPTATGQGVAVTVSFDPETTHSLEQQQGGWQAILDSFTRYVEAQQA